MAATPVNAEPTQEQVEKAVEVILQELMLYGVANKLQADGIKCFTNKDFTTIKLMAVANLEDSLLRSLTYLSSALTTKQASAIPTILAEAARAAADFAKERTLRHLGSQIIYALTE